MKGGFSIKKPNIDPIRDDKSWELFGKQYKALTSDEISLLNEYLYDISHPEYKDIIIAGEKSGYLVSNVGVIIGKRKSPLIPDISNTGYYCVNGYHRVPIKIRIHRMVATMFIPNPQNKPQVNHMNGNKLCNWYKNLEWVTGKENMQHAVQTGLQNFKGILHPENIYSEEQIRIACKMLENPDNKLIDIERVSGINRSILYSIRCRRSWTHISKDYNIPIPIKQKEIPIDDIKKACDMWKTTTYSKSQISRITGVPCRTMNKVLNGSPYYDKRINKRIEK